MTEDFKLVRNKENKPNIHPFVQMVFRRKGEDAGFRARMRAARSVSRAPAVWGDLAAFTSLRNEDERRILILIGSAIAWDRAGENGDIPLGRAIAKAWGLEGAAARSDDLQKGPAAVRIRRLLACRTIAEVCMVLQPLLSLIRSREVRGLDYSRLLYNLHEFIRAPEKVKAIWAHDFFAMPDTKKEGSPS